MNEKQFEQMDEWFREASQHHDEPFNEASWKELEPRLDALEPANKKRRFFWWWFSGTALLLIGLLISSNGLFFNKKENNKPVLATNDKKTSFETEEQANKKNADENKINMDDSIVTKKESSMVNPLIERNKKPIETKPEAIANRTSKNVEESSQKTGFKKPLSAQDKNNAEKYLGEQASITTPDELADQSKSTDALSNNSAAHKQNMPSLILENGLDVTVDNNKDKQEILSSQGLNTESLKPDSPGSAALNSAKESASTPTLKPIKKPKIITWTLSPLAAVEWSKTGANASGPATFAYGGNLGIQLGRWGFQSGLRVTHKKYGAGPNDYKAKPGSYYALPHVTIKTVDASCKVMEIPMLISYRIPAGKKTEIITAAGANHAVMAREDYHYYFYRNGAPYYAKSEYTTGQIAWFSSAVIMAGYQFNIGKKMTMYAAPYMQLPLRGVGEGSVKITSFGIQTGLTIMK